MHENGFCGELDDEIMTCWCGVTGTYDELFDYDCLSGGCGGSGYVYCYCGGDFCCCHHHNQEVECPGCDDCEDIDDDDFDDFGRDDDFDQFEDD